MYMRHIYTAAYCNSYHSKWNEILYSGTVLVCGHWTMILPISDPTAFKPSAKFYCYIYESIVYFISDSSHMDIGNILEHCTTSVMKSLTVLK